MHTTRRAGTLAVLSAAVLLTAACGGEGVGSGDADADTSELDIAWNAQPPTLDPVVTTATTTRDITSNIFESLLALDSSGQVHDVLSESHEFSDDGATITFTLRDDVVFHDGSPMEAADVVASLERWIEISTAGQQFFEGTEVSAGDDGTVVVTTPEPMYTAAQLLADPNQMAAVMPAEVVESAPAEGTDEIIGTGPYALVNWQTDQHVELERFEDYVSPPGEPSGMAGAKDTVFDTIYFHFVSDPSTRVSGLQTGEYDAANALPFDSYPQLEGDANLTVDVSDNGYNGLVFNKRNGLMAEPAMRQAVAASLDMQAVQQAAFADEQFFTLNGALMTPEQGDWYTEVGTDRYNLNDPDLVEQYLDEAGYDGETVRILTTREYEDHYNHAVVVESQLNAAGINVQLEVTDWATVLDNRTDDTAYEIFITGFTPAAVPTRFVYLSSSWPGWTDDPAITEAMDMITYASDEESASQAVDDLQQAFYDYLPIAKFGDKSNITAYRADLGGYEFMPGGGDVFFRMAPAS